jgi:hypothetical protein
MFLRSKVQEMILRRRSRSMHGASAQRGHAPADQLASPSTVPCGNAGSGGGKSALFASPRLSHSSSLPAGSVFGKGPAEPSEAAAFSISPTSVLDAAAPFADVAGGSRRPWREGLHGLADALECGRDEQPQPSLVRSCSLDRRVEFGVKDKSSWLPLSGGGREVVAASPAAAASLEPGGETTEVVMEPSSEDYTCVICRGPNPRTVHIFGDRVVEDGAESSPRPINPPAREEGVAVSSL